MLVSEDIQLAPADISSGVAATIRGDDSTLYVATFQQGVLTLSANILNTETVTIDGKVYTFQDTLTNVDGNVHIGTDAEATLANLRDAINLGAGAGTDYATLMTLHSTVLAISDATTLTVISKLDGAQTYATTETIVTGGAWDDVTIDGTADAINIQVELSPDGVNYYDITESPLVFADAGFSTLNMAYKFSHIRLTGTTSIYVRAQLRSIVKIR